MKIILLLFLIAVLYVSITTIIKFGFNRNTLLIIFSKVWWLRGFFFIMLYIYVCIGMMYAVNDNSSYFLLPFLVCGIAAVLSMYKKTQKYGLYLFIISCCFGLFVILPLVGIINSYNKGNASNIDLIGALIFICVGLFVGIYCIINIYKQNRK